MSSGNASHSLGDQDSILRAGGVIYTIQVELERSSLDWLDHILLELAEEPQPVEEIFAAFPMPTRLLENALSDLLQRNLLLLDVQAGCVRASKLAERPTAEPRVEPVEIWQDHATGMLLPAEQVMNWAAGRRKDGETDGEREILRGGPPKKTPKEMSHAELLHRLRFRLDIARTATVRSCSKQRSMALDVRARRRPDGRLAVKDAIPWPLRVAWAKLGNRLTLDDEPALEVAFPTTWSETVGAWLQGAHERIKGLKPTVGSLSLSRLRRVLDSHVTIESSSDGAVVTKRLAREALSSVVVSVSAGHGSPGEAVQILQECSHRHRFLLLSGLEVRHDKQEEWEQQGIRVVPIEGRHGPDFLLVDGRILAFGGVHARGTKVWTVRSRMPLDGYIAWLAEVGVTLEPVIDEAAGSEDLDRDLRAFESELQDLVDSRGHVELRGEPASDPRSQSVEDFLRERCRELQARLGLSSVTPAGWVPSAEVLAFVEQWAGSLRVLVRDRFSSLATAALSRGVESAVWLNSDAPVDCVITERVVLLGFSLEAGSSGPDFLAVNDGELASRIRVETANLSRLG